MRKTVECYKSYLSIEYAWEDSFYLYIPLEGHIRVIKNALEKNIEVESYTNKIPIVANIPGLVLLLTFSQINYVGLSLDVNKEFVGIIFASLRTIFI